MNIFTVVVRIGAKLLFKIFPLKQRVLISSYKGTKQADSPLQIFTYLKEKYPQIDIIWLGKKQGCDDIPYLKYESIGECFIEQHQK